MMNRKNKGKAAKRSRNDGDQTPKRGERKRTRQSNRVDRETASSSNQESSHDENSQIDQQNTEQERPVFRAVFQENDDIVTMDVNEEEEAALGETDTVNDSIQSSDEEGEIVFNSSQERSLNNNATVTAQVHRAMTPTRSRPSRIAEETVTEVDEPQVNPQQLIHETIQRTMEQLFKEGRLKNEDEMKAQAKKATFRYASPLEKSGKIISNNSDLTIYERAVKDKTRESSSSEDLIDTSDEQINNSDETINPACDGEAPQSEKIQSTGHNNTFNVNMIDQVLNNIAEQTLRDGKKKEDRYKRAENPQPSTSRDRDRSPDELADQLVKQAELSKAQIYDTPGKHDELNVANDFVHSSLVDQNYKIVGAHVDPATRAKIVNNEYIDFAKLIPRDRVLTEEDNRVQWII